MPRYKLKRKSYRTAKYKSDVTLEVLDSPSKENVYCDNNNTLINTPFSDSNSDENTENYQVTRKNTKDLLVPNNFSSSSTSDEIEEENSSKLTKSGNKSLNPDSTETFTQFISKWATDFKIPHVAINPLLSSINIYFNANLPSDARTLLKTPRNIHVQFIEPGQYYHFGVSVAITKLLNKYDNINSLQSIKININVDGLPISKSNSSQLYPILCNLLDNVSVVEMIGLYYGLDKPKDANSLLASSIDEIVHLINNGFCFDGKTYPFQLCGLICDAPAKSFICYIKGHTGYSSCTKCYVVGSFVNNRICFPQTNNLKLRCNEDFRNKIDEDHHCGVSLIESIPKFDFIKNIPLDPMHLIYLGVMKKLLLIWVDEYLIKIIRKQNIIQSTITDIAEDVNQLKNQINRKVEHLEETRESIFMLLKLPVESQIELDELEHYLSTEAQLNNAVKEISSSGGKDVYELIYRATGKLITNGFAAGFSYLGRQKKQKFSCLKINRLLIDSAVKTFECTEKDAELAISKWLRRCAERAKKEKQP